MRNVKSGSDWPCWLHPSPRVRSDLRFPWWRTLSGLSACSVWQAKSLWIESPLRKQSRFAQDQSSPIRHHKWFPILWMFCFHSLASCLVSSAGRFPYQTPGLWIENILLSPNHVNNPYIADGCLSDILCVVGEIQNCSGISQEVLTSRQKRALRASNEGLDHGQNITSTTNCNLFVLNERHYSAFACCLGIKSMTLALLYSTSWAKCC